MGASRDLGHRPGIDELLGRVRLWRGQPVTAVALPGGLSHQIWRVDGPTGSYVLRVLEPAVHAAGLGIATDLEVTNTRRAASAGVGARVFEVLPDVPALVLEFLPGRTLNPAAVRDPANLPGIVAACRRLHAGPRFANDFSVVAALYRLLDICRRRDLRLPDGYLDRLSTVDAIEAALAARPLPAVPCHNDLLAENFIDLGAGDMRIVDYQLSGNNDPSFELGDIAAEADFEPDRTEALAAAYFGAEASPALLARVRLNLALSNMAWSLWFSVHHGLLRNPDISFDYWGESADKWAQARRDLDSTELGRLLSAASGRRGPGPLPSGT
jgi:thiamine kinase-like enzyme